MKKKMSDDEMLLNSITKRSSQDQKLFWNYEKIIQLRFKAF